MIDVNPDGPDDLVTSRHKQLERIATLANVCCWIVFLVFTGLAIGKFVGAQNLAFYRSTLTNQPISSFSDLWYSDPLHATYILADAAATFLEGVVFAVVLKGVAAGLNMLIEVELNYKLSKKPGGGS
jgi:hypothetical protein